MERTIHIFSYVDLYMDRTIHLCSYVELYMDRHNFFHMDKYRIIMHLAMDKLRGNVGLVIVFPGGLFAKRTCYTSDNI